VVVPKEKRLPEGLLGVSVVDPQFSETVGTSQLTTAWHDAVALTVMFPGHPVITGGELSMTFTLKEHVAEFPAASVAV
jgi:hypothetical protein